MMDWAELNPDLLRLILKKLGDISNFVHFRAVCKNWRLVVGLRDCPPQLPWFLESKIEDLSNRNSFSLYSNRTHTLHIPQAKQSYMLGAPNRYIFMDDFLRGSTSLFNPLTRSHFSIPQNWSHLPCPIYIGRAHNPNPNVNENDSIEVILLNRKKDGLHHIVYWRFASRRWTEIVEVDVPYARAIIYFQGRLFVFDWKTAETRVFDSTTGDEVLVVPPAIIRFDYLIDGCGDLLGVVKESMWEGERQFEVYRLEDNGTDSR